MSRARPLLRVLTWNVHGCVGRSRRFDPKAVGAELARLKPDIAALQEIDSRRRLAGDIDTFEYLTDVIEASVADARTIRTPHGDYGHMLASRWPLEDVERIDLSVGRREPRMAISVRVCHPETAIRVIAAHLGLGGRERRRQIDLLQAHLSHKAERAAIVLGDFNEWRRGGLATRTLCPPFEVAAALPSFPSRRPLFALDRIWCRAPLDAHAAQVHLSARELSDHLPVLAEIGLGQH